jgi:hypothetical protein
MVAKFRDRLIAAGAPSDFMFHAWRHTIAMFFKERTEWERGLLLNHSSSSVTAGGAIEIELLTEWTDHVESLVAA